MSSNVAATAYTLTVPGARLHYEVRGSGPVLALIGAPMDGAGRLLAGIDDLYATFRREGAEAAMVKFFALTGPDGSAVVDRPTTSDPLPPPCGRPRTPRSSSRI